MSPPPGTSTASRGKVVIVDDSDLVLDLATLRLEEAGFTPIPVDNPFDVAAVIVREQPICLLMDVNMPSLQGDAIVQIINRYGMNDCVILLHSDRPESELKELVRTSGADGYLRKTDDDEEFVSRIEQFLSRRAAGS